MRGTISFDRAVETYDATRSLPPQVMAKVVEKLVEVLERRECHDILDAGVGTGRFSAPLQEYGFDVAGVDVSLEMLGRARAKSVRNVARGDVCRMPFKDKSFDATLMMHILHLVREWRQALSEVRRVTSKVLVSITGTFPQSEGPVESYKTRLLESGWPEIFPGIHERDLVNTIPPSESNFAATSEQERAAEEVLDLLDRRTYSYQWDVPEEVHRRIMAQLRTDYTGKRLRSSRELNVSVWDVERL